MIWQAQAPAKSALTANLCQLVANVCSPDGERCELKQSGMYIYRNKMTGSIIRKIKYNNED